MLWSNIASHSVLLVLSRWCNLGMYIINHIEGLVYFIVGPAYIMIANIAPWGKIIYIFLRLNTSYLIDSYIVFTLKMESQPKNIIFSLKMMMKSDLEKNILKFLHAGNYFFLFHKISKITNLVTKKNIFPHGGNSN